MRMLSAPSAVLAPPEAAGAPALLTGLTEQQLKDCFLWFAEFLYYKKEAHEDTTMSATIFTTVVEHFIQLTGAVPDWAPGTPLPSPLRTPKAPHKQAIFRNVIGGVPTSGATLAQIIVAYFEDFKFTASAEDLFKFKLYLYLMILHFEIWFCGEVFSDTKGRLPQPVRDYTEEVIKSGTTDLSVRLDDGFFSSNEYRDSFGHETSMNLLKDDSHLGECRKYVRAGRTILGFRSGVAAADKLEVLHSVIRHFKRAMIETLNRDMRQFTSTLFDATTPGNLELVSGFLEFSVLALGEGSGTSAFFDDVNYGLLFFDYKLKPLSSGKISVERFQLGVPLVNSSAAANSAVCVAYIGLQRPPVGSYPSVRIYGSDHAGRPLGESVVFYATSPAFHLPEAHGHKLKADAVRLSSFSGATGLLGDLGTDTEELAYIVFRHAIPGATQAFKLNARWELPTNEFHKTSSDVLAEIFAGQDTDLEALVKALAADSAFEVDAFIDGLGIGGTGSSPWTLARRGNQIDSSWPSDDPQVLRAGEAELYWYPAAAGGGWLIFVVHGFVSPLRCTWDTAKAPDYVLPQYQLMFTEVGQHLPEYKGAPSYNCVLSAFRAFALFEAMIERIKLSAKQAVLDGVISSSQQKAIESKLVNYLEQQASCKILLPRRPGELDREAVKPDPGGGPDIPIRVTHAFIHEFMPP